LNDEASEGSPIGPKPATLVSILIVTGAHNVPSVFHGVPVTVLPIVP
jgi:hypothetical protein